MKIVVLTALWGRGPLTKLMLDRLRTQGVEVVAVGSGQREREIAEASGAHYVEHPNSPLSLKWQHGLHAAKTLDPDAVLILGSDDFVSDGLLLQWASLLDEHTYVGLLDLLFYAPPELLHWPGYTINRRGELIGAGRCLRRDLLDEIAWTLWVSERDRTLDLEATERLAQHGAVPHCLWMADDVWAVDVKTTTGITHIDDLRAWSERLKGTALDQRFGAGFQAEVDRAVLACTQKESQ